MKRLARRAVVVRNATTVYIGIGSNIRPQQEIPRCLKRLADCFGNLKVSPAYRAAALGFDGPAFINLVVRFDTTLPLAEVLSRLKAIEGGRLRKRSRKNGSRPIDLDLLLYGDLSGFHQGIQLPRADITEFAFVLWPLTDIASELKHPVLRKTCRQLRNDFQHSQRLRRCYLKPHTVSFS